jgi:hypothetical protein
MAPLYVDAGTTISGKILQVSDRTITRLYPRARKVRPNFTKVRL